MAIRNLLPVDDKLWFERKVDDWFLRNKTKRSAVGYFRPSGMSRCMRENQYCYIGVANYPDFDLSSMKRMHRGSTHHDMWEDIFRESGVGIISGKKNRIECLDPRITGEWDFKLYEIKLLNGEKILVDLKSVQYIWNPPKIEYLIQWNLYAYLDDEEIKNGYIIKEDPASIDFKAYPVKLEKDFIEPYIKELKNVEKCSREGILLPRDERCGRGKQWRPSSCDLNKFCHSELGDDPWSILKNRQVVDIYPANKFACESAEILNGYIKEYKYNIICDECYNKEDCNI